MLDLAAEQILQVRLVSLLNPVVSDPMAGQKVGPPPQVDVDGEEEDQDSRVEDSQVYQIKYIISHIRPDMIH